MGTPTFAAAARAAFWHRNYFEKYFGSPWPGPAVEFNAVISLVAVFKLSKSRGETLRVANHVTVILMRTLVCAVNSISTSCCRFTVRVSRNLL